MGDTISGVCFDLRSDAASILPLIPTFGDFSSYGPLLIAGLVSTQARICWHKDYRRALRVLVLAKTPRGRNCIRAGNPPSCLRIAETAPLSPAARTE